MKTISKIANAAWNLFLACATLFLFPLLVIGHLGLKKADNAFDIFQQEKKETKSKPRIVLYAMKAFVNIVFGLAIAAIVMMVLISKVFFILFVMPMVIHYWKKNSRAIDLMLNQTIDASRKKKEA